MKSENRALAVVVLTVVVVAAAGGAYFYLSPQSLPATLPIPEGMTFTVNDSASWTAYFNVSATDVRLVGAWTAFQGYGLVGLRVVNGSMAKPGPFLLRCPLLQHWAQSNGSIDEPVGPGPHTIFWTTGYCSGAMRIEVTQSIRLAGPALILSTSSAGIR